MDNTNKNPIFSIKNFRSFGEDGADFELAPITVLTGCNSAGKSSLVKAQLLLNQVIPQISQQIDYRGPLRFYKLDRIALNTADKNLNLGNYHKVLNTHADNGTISMSYIIHSNYLAEKVEVSLEFNENQNDVVDNGSLKKITIKKLDGTIIWRNDLIEDPIGNCEAIIDNFTHYLLYKYLTDYHSKLQKHSPEDIEKENKTIYKHILDLCERYGLLKKDNIDEKYHLGKEIMKFRKTKGVVRVELPSIETLDRWINDRSFYSYLPIFKAVEGKPKSEVRKYLEDCAKQPGGSGVHEEKTLDWIKYFCDDIEASPYTSFKDYFHNKEREFWREGLLQWLPNFELCTLDAWERDENWNWVERDVTRLSREQYDERWNIPNVIDALEIICMKKNWGQPLIDDTCNVPEIPADKDRLQNCLAAYYNSFVLECISPDFLCDIKYIDSSSAAVKRLYSVEDSDKMGICLKNYLNGNQQQHTRTDLKNRSDYFPYTPGTFTNKWFDKFKIGNKINIEGTAEGLGLLLYLVNGDKKRLLADEGYGITQLATLILQIENSILTATRDIIWDDGLSEDKVRYIPSTICVEEPEIHLHPKYQSILADMFVDAYQNYNIHFIIETHSEYLIRKLQVMVADKENALTSNDVSLNYVEKNEEGISYNRPIKIKEDGSLSESFGKGFYDEADDLTMELLRYKAQIRK